MAKPSSSPISNSRRLLGNHTQTGTELSQVDGYNPVSTNSSQRITIQSCDCSCTLSSLERDSRVFHPEQHKLTLMLVMQVFLWPEVSIPRAPACSFPC